MCINSCGHTTLQQPLPAEKPTNRTLLSEASIWSFSSTVVLPSNQNRHISGRSCVDGSSCKRQRETERARGRGSGGRGDRDRRREGSGFHRRNDRKGGEGWLRRDSHAESESRDPASLESLFWQRRRRRRQKRRPLMILSESVPVPTGMSEFWRFPPRIHAPSHSATCACWSGAELRL